MRLLGAAGRGRVAAFAALVVVVGLLPTGVIVLTGALVDALPGAVGAGPRSPQAQPALLAMAGLASVLAALALAGNTLSWLARVLDDAFALEVQRAVARAALGPPGLAPLEDPAFADELQAVQDAERRGVLRRTVTALSSVATTRLRGCGALVLLFAWSWWAPLLLAAAWQLTNLLFLRATANGISVQLSDGATRIRRAEYLRALALEPPAAKELRVFGLGGWVVGRYGDAWREALGVVWRSRRASRGLTAAATASLLASHALVLGMLGAAAVRGEVDAAALLVLVQAVLATSDLGMLDDWQWFLAQSLAVAARVVRLGDRVPPGSSLDAEPARPRLPAASPAAAVAAAADVSRASAPRGRVAVRLDGVRFTYRGRQTPALDGLSLEIPAGQSLAIVGENGAGKSTLIKLLCGLYEPDGGRITLDGAATPLQARGRIGVIFQDFVRYPLPLRENVGFGHLPLMADAAALEGALRDAGGGALPASLPAGWDTPLSRELEGGADLSGGQWQRVALARALAAVRGGAGLLILDEPTAALDVRSETELFERFLALTRGVTTILVSHRLSSVRHADRIVVIDGGRVAEDGTHDALVRAGGRYARMYALQAERFVADAPAVREAADA
ncbi:ABC transporter ATP-binding protein [Longimicrobium sp.]|uniref:ABC transporter ATP-binding protein n=1 Tax=Longimicrobium sp. TaxID=2029185 RepID=UPI002C25DD7F|nr:ABC transporter ATP-binding protein [Longimicrobium sp.]HSU14831.1 ABC transporter ATP-binding protein [Longimicrobium sp.]